MFTMLLARCSSFLGILIMELISSFVRTSLGESSIIAVALMVTTAGTIFSEFVGAVTVTVSQTSFENHLPSSQ